MTDAGGTAVAMDRGLVAAGRALGLVTHGRHSGLGRSVTVGFVDGPDGMAHIAANEPTTAWALNLLADPSCEVRIGDRRFHAVAEPLADAEHAAAVRALILRYGTPSEGLGRGPSFRLRPTGPADTPGSAA